MTVEVVVILAGVGAALALALIALHCLRGHLWMIRRRPELQRQWRSLDRRARRQIRRSQRYGEAPPPEHAAFALAILDAIQEIDDERGAAARARFRRVVAGYVLGLACGVFTIRIGGPMALGVGAFVEGFYATLCLNALRVYLQDRRGRRNLPRARAAALRALSG